MDQMSAVDRHASVLKYPLRMRVLHWSMAVIILALIWAGWVMISPDETTLSKFDFLYPWHKSFGMLILFAALVRLVTRLRARKPELPVGLAGWEKTGAKVGHALLYTLMIVLPLRRSVELRAAMASLRDAVAPMLVRSRPSRTR